MSWISCDYGTMVSFCLSIHLHDKKVSDEEALDDDDVRYFEVKVRWVGLVQCFGV